MTLNFNYLKCIAVFLLAVTISSCEKTSTDVAVTSQKVKEKSHSILIFSKTAGWRHKSIEVGVEALTKLADENNWSSESSEDSSIFTDQKLKQFSAVVFLNTTGDIFNESQQLALERYIQAGGGFVGIHAATDTEHDWHWFGRMIGGRFKSHPKIQSATLNVVSENDMVQGLAKTFEFTDEWYNFKSLSDRRIDLITLDETSYEGGENGKYHPISWYHNFDGGRVFYTGLGHRKENFTDPIFMTSVAQGLRYAIGDNVTLNYTKSRPEPNRFVKKVLVDGLGEPVSLDISANGEKIIWIERKGNIYWYDLNKKKQYSAGSIPIYSAEGFGEFGLLTIALDPNFNANNFAYFMYNTKYKSSDEKVIQRISRFTFNKGVIDLASEKVMIDVPSDDTCCHTGGNMEFDQQGHLYVALGDNTNPFRSAGVGPTDNRPDRAIDDALRSSGNTQDLRGKILRILPTDDGGYTNPPGNLFEDSSQGRPEIYVMGARNPYTLAYDNVEETLYYGDVGPDNRVYNPERGAKGYDEVNRVKSAGNFGWPLFIGFNQPYRYFDYVSKKAGEWYAPQEPINRSPRNTGSKTLPPAQQPIIAYPYGYSDEFPELGAGSRNALVAGVYRAPLGPNENEEIKAYPEYYDGKLFISDFMRRWIKAVSFDSTGKIVKIDDFAPDVSLVAPIDLKFSVNGELYILEYGSKWHNANEDARLSRIQYIGDGNRPPVAEISLSNNKGAKPFAVNANANKSFDPDNDEITYRWQITTLPEATSLVHLKIDDAFKVITGSALDAEIADNGKYALILEATDSHGDKTYQHQAIEVGNAPPKVEIKFAINQSFMWPNGVSYQVLVSDVEDGMLHKGIAANDVYISVNQLNQAALKKQVGHADGDPYAAGRKAVKESNCLGCHQLTQKSVGPSFNAIADKYQPTVNADKYLSNTIASGSTGKWGQHQMPAHDFLKEDVRQSIASYILSQTSKAESLKPSSVLKPSKGIVKYELSATYTDKGLPGFEAITTTKTVSLISSSMRLAHFITHAGELNGVKKERGKGAIANLLNHGTSLDIGEYDLTSVKAITVSQYFSPKLNKYAELEVRIGSKRGKVIAKGKFTDYARIKALSQDEIQYSTFELNKPIQGKKRVFLVVNQPDKPDAQAFRLGSIEFVAQ